MPPDLSTAAAAGSDASLLTRIVARDAAALAELYDRHSRLVFGLVLRILRNRDEAEDVLQEAFVQAWSRAATYRAEQGSPAGWLVGIARNRAIDRLRASAVRARERDQITAEPAVPEPSAGERLDIQRALGTLPSDQRELIEQAYFQGFTHTELAARTGLPLGTVKTRIRAGMQTLRACLAGGFVQS